MISRHCCPIDCKTGISTIVLLSCDLIPATAPIKDQYCALNIYRVMCHSGFDHKMEQRIESTSDELLLTKLFGDCHWLLHLHI